jgi:tetratricopeptide (TPR) repeat protein
MAQLSHPSVVPVFDVGTVDEAGGGGVFIAMELVEGQTLRDWLKAARRPWKDVVKALVAAGRGLAAAHAAGIVHRDFKPANVLVGMDGRVRVTDFGLARVDDAVLGPDEAGEAGGVAGLTMRTAGIAGTPGYVAPEALDGVVDARGDQFAFCVSLYEALYGERPFAAGTGSGRSPLIELAEEVRRGAVKPAPRGARVPGWLRAIVVRGLSPAPERRWPTLAALLDEIERVPRRRRAIGAMLASAAVVVPTVAYLAVADPARAKGLDCGAAGRVIDKRWNEPLRRSIRDAFALVPPHGPGEATAILAQLDEYARAWSDARVDTCRATHERGEQSSEALDLRTRCLDRALGELYTLGVVLARGGPSAVANARSAVAALPAPETCSLERVSTVLPMPDDPRVEASEAFLSEARALRDLGDHRAAIPEMEQGLALAEAIGHPALVADALILRANLVGGGDADAAIADLQRALEAGVAARDPRREARAAMELLNRVASKGVKAAIEPLLPVVRAAVTRVEGDSGIQVRFASVESYALRRMGRFDEALTACEQIRRHGASRAQGADRCSCQALNQYKPADAIPVCTRALEAIEAEFGPGHHETEVDLRGLALAHNRLGNYEEALALRLRVVSIVEAVRGPGTSNYAEALHGVANVLSNLNRFPEAIAYYERALMAARASGAQDEEARVLANLSVAHMNGGDEHQALAYAEQQIALSEQLLGEDSVAFMELLFVHGQTLSNGGRHADALLSFERGVRIGERGVGPRLMLGYHLMGKSQALSGLGRAAEAIAPARRAVEIIDREQIPPADRWSVHAVLGKALVRAGQSEEGRRILRNALKELRAIGPTAQLNINAIEAVLRE